jgi:hypothetical protein
MNHTRSIKLINDGFFRQYIVVHVSTTQEAFWDIREIEIFSHPDHSPESLIADDIRFSELPGSTQMAIVAALDEREHEHRQRMHGLRHLMVDIRADEADFAAARIWSGA